MRARREENTPAGAATAPPELRPFLAYLAMERGFARNTVEAYRRDLTDALRFLQARGVDLNTAATDDLRAYLQAKSLAGLMVTTVTRRHAALRAFLSYLRELGVAGVQAKLDGIEAPKAEEPLPKVLSQAQVGQLLAAPNPRSSLFLRDVAVVELLYAAGLRASELCDLRLRDVAGGFETVHISGKGSKDRIVIVHATARAAIARYVAECRPRLAGAGKTDRLFLSRTGHPFERIALWMLIERLGRRAGLAKAISPHVLRHCFATHLHAGGADLRVIQELLGHSDVTTTEVYTHLDPTKLKGIHKRFHPRG
jgi:integrase/recombinase XerD